MRKLFTVLATALFVQSASAGPVAFDDDLEAEVYVVKVHADWCGSCKALTEPLAQLMAELGDQPVLYVELDFTDETTTRQAVMLAEALDIDDAIAENASSGKVLLIEEDSDEVVAVLTRKNTLPEMKAAVEKALDES